MFVFFSGEMESWIYAWNEIWKVKITAQRCHFFFFKVKEVEEGSGKVWTDMGLIRDLLM